MATEERRRDVGPTYDVSDGLYVCAARGGHQHVIEWLEVQGVMHSEHCDESACEAAAAGGHLPFLKWLRSRPSPYPWSETTCKIAAANGHLDVLQWARANGARWERTLRGETEWCTDMVNEAVEGGHLECLQWIVNNGFPRSIPQTPSYAGDAIDELSYMAMYADGNHPHVMQCLEASGFPMDLVKSRKVRTGGGRRKHTTC